MEEEEYYKAELDIENLKEVANVKLNLQSVGYLYFGILIWLVLSKELGSNITNNL
jgi:hypothetical protein